MLSSVQHISHIPRAHKVKNLLKQKILKSESKISETSFNEWDQPAKKLINNIQNNSSVLEDFELKIISRDPSVRQFTFNQSRKGSTNSLFQDLTVKQTDQFNFKKKLF
ncbi:Hypothetical_protein [Hexamita inflata]|uniref:Hypothetical_protein n=1 Tax=Hexamita inflata TaxID=28002 RepID=A0ABP1IZN4_9EUKA